MNGTSTTPAWIVYAWAPVLWQASSADELNLVHLGTRVLTFGDETNPRTGQTLWGDASENRATGIAWDWVEIRDGVVAMSDPLGMVTNLRLLDIHGELCNQMQIAVHLHQLVHKLPWQIEIQRVLHKPRVSPKYVRASDHCESVITETAFRPRRHLLQRTASSTGHRRRSGDAAER